MKFALGKIGKIKRSAHRILVSKNHAKQLAGLKAWLDSIDTEHIWVFTAAEFQGNPKYLFTYINYYRPDIKAVWLGRSAHSVQVVRKLGFKAWPLSSPVGAYLAERAGVYVDEQVRIDNPFAKRTNIKFLNLWHGVGNKIVERARNTDDDDLRFEIATKYIKYNRFYINNQLICVANSNQARYFPAQMGLEKDQLLKTGYLRCLYQQNYRPVRTYDHDLLVGRKLQPGTKIVVFAPTFRRARGHTFAEAMPDLKKLYHVCEKHGILFIFKMHPMMTGETAFRQAKKLFGDRPHFLFWNNKNDFYEIMPKVDLLIYDYSSIFSDCLLAGVKNYLRYLFDYDGTNLAELSGINSEAEFFRDTCGEICLNFAELLQNLAKIGHSPPKTAKKVAFSAQSAKICAKIAKITADLPENGASPDQVSRRIWEYAGENDFEKTIDAVFNFQIKTKPCPTLYSFDIFDTLITREGLTPKSIFYQMRDRLRGNRRFNSGFTERFPERRQMVEAGLRQNMDRSLEQRRTLVREITLEQIYREIQVLEGLTATETAYLMDLECKLEVDAARPLPEQIKTVKKLLAKGETVVLISDMYLPRKIIRRILKKVEPTLARLPLFLSNESGTMKNNGLLFFEVYRSLAPYRFGQWVHTGDAPNGDQTQPRKFGIHTRLVPKPELNDPEKGLVKTLGTTDACRLTAMQARMRAEFPAKKADFVLDLIAPLFTAYLDWVLTDAMRKKFETLYFISRDGHYLKLVADAIIKAKNLPLKTKYIYLSRKTLRLPAQIDAIDDEFFMNNGGNFNNIHSKSEFLKAAYIDAGTFARLFPSIDLNSVDFADYTKGQPARKLGQTLKTCPEYREFLLRKAAKKRKTVCAYLKQEVNTGESHAFVEFLGRGYNQDCHARLANYLSGHSGSLPYYYARVHLDDNTLSRRFHFTTTNINLYFLEAVLANLPYASVEKYVKNHGKLAPVLRPIYCDRELFSTLNFLLPEFARRFSALSLSDPTSLRRDVFEFLLSYCENHKTEPFIAENFGALVDQPGVYGTLEQFARPYTETDITDFEKGVPRGEHSLSISMSYARSPESVKKAYDELYQVEKPGEIAKNSVLKPSELKKNRKIAKLLAQEREKAENFAKIYQRACRESPPKNQISLVSAKKSLGDQFFSLNRKLAEITQKSGGISRDTSQNAFSGLSVRKIIKKDFANSENVAQIIASSKLIVLGGPIPQFSGLDFRAESKVLLLQDSAFELYKKGRAAHLKLKQEQLYQAFLYDLRPDVLEIPANSAKDYLCSKYGTLSENARSVKGCAVTDVYFDESFRETAYQHLFSLFPEAKGRKIVAFLPDLRRKTGVKDYFELPDLEELRRMLGDGYVFITNVANRKIPLSSGANLFEYYQSQNAKMLNSDLSIRSLIAAADIIVGDFRDTFFESALLKKPVFFTGFDFENYQKSPNFRFDFARSCPFPLISTTEELAERIVDAENYDFAPVRKFRTDYLTDCDGKTAERILEYWEKL